MASANRLHLDFKLSTNEERKAFLDNYLLQPEFIQHPPSDEELETMSNYLLWGKDPKTGLNAKQEGLVDIETKHSTWSKKTEIESLEGLLEQPTFNEASIVSINNPTPFKVKKEVFSRQEALAQCPENLLDEFKQLFALIDRTELTINFYEIAHGKREKPPREQLLNRFSPEEQDCLRERASHWNQYQYLKMRHELVEMRREQYTMRDSFVTPILSQGAVPDFSITKPEFGIEIEVLPLGLKNKTDAAALIFRKWEQITPQSYGEEDLQIISDLYWEKKNYFPTGQQRYFDFRELEHVYQVFQIFFELRDAAEDADLESNLPELMDTLNFYIERTELSEIHKEILDMKLRKVKNVDIAIEINKKWNKTYTPNYISTIFRQRIIPKINETAAYHQKLVSNVFFEEEFKSCSICKRTLLRAPENFTRRARSKDGFTSCCKECEKRNRLKNRVD